MVDNPARIDYTISRAVNASVAQSVEQGTENPRVGGSIPPGGTIKYAAVAHLVERHLAKVEVASSSLVSRSKNKTPVIDRRFIFGNGYKARKGVKQNSPVGCFVARVIRPTAPVGRSLAKSGLNGRILRPAAGIRFASLPFPTACPATRTVLYSLHTKQRGFYYAACIFP